MTVYFMGISDGEKKTRSNSLTLNLFKRISGRNRRKENSISLSGSLHANPMDMAFEVELGNIRSYEIVTPVTITLNRPLLVFGPLKERVIDALLQDPKFTSCVPHTSRPPRPGELDGVDYNFVGSKAQMEEQIRADRFIEVGQFQDHYYATSVDSVRHVLQSGELPVVHQPGRMSFFRLLTLVGKYFRHEKAHEGLHPISVLLKPLSVLHLRAIQRRLTEDQANQAKRSIDLALRLEADNWRLFSSTLISGVFVPFRLTNTDSLDTCYLLTFLLNYDWIIGKDKPTPRMSLIAAVEDMIM
ncbi:unnamed protein product [Echinostoma caproni]|uniref:Guanylate kinase-like domain-containing protein n=1 Tax=Echinostoma caproni TaxID=27848 RepID=A0A183ALH9_9TREM|nr:unnamed protein product [Echinostoma caproni]